MRLENVWVRYRRRGPWVLCGVEAGLDAGEVATVSGHNGAGKSTLLKTVAGLLRPARGAVRDRPARIGYVPERFPADQPFTARRYLTAMARVSGQPAAEVPEAIEHWAERLHMRRLLDTALPELSKGTAQKVGLIQGMLCRPELLILDEPWEGLDATTRAEVPRIIAGVVADGGRVLISDHLDQAGAVDGVRRWELTDGTITEAVNR